MHKRLLELEVKNFRSLRQVSVPLGPLNVLVGPNGAGKSNLLDVFKFLADIVQTDIEPALAARGGFESTTLDRKSTRLNSTHVSISYACFCMKKIKLYGRDFIDNH